MPSTNAVVEAVVEAELSILVHELIERVKRAEEKADALLASAQEKARALVEDADAQSRDYFDKRVKALGEKKEKLLADAEGAGRKEAEALLKKSAAERKTLEAKWRGNAPRAAAFVKEFILKQ